MRVRIDTLGEGPGPDEVVIEVKTASGITEQVVVSASTIVQDMIEVGYPIHRLPERILVELPRESVSGRWRLWVPTSNVIDG